jgi:hypothetical protein
MTKEQTKELLACCAVLGFSKESHFMRATYSNGVGIVLYVLPPIGDTKEHAAVLQAHPADGGAPKADFYTDFEQAKSDLLHEVHFNLFGES